MSRSFDVAPLKGVIPPVLTTLNQDRTFDKPAFARLLDHMIQADVHGLFVLGTTGEGPQLSAAVQREVIIATREHVQGRLPVLVGITHTSLHESIDLARFSAEHGADAVVTAGPCYSPISQNELVAYARELADQSPLPVILYNMPSHTKIWFEQQTVATLAQHPNIIGVKDTSGDLLYHNRLILEARNHGDFAVLVGTEQLMGEAVLMGANGAVVGGANLHPELYVSLYEAAVADDVATTRELQQKVIEMTGRLYTIGDSPSSYLLGLKAALSQLGICQNHAQLPLVPLDEQQCEEVAQIMKDFELLAVAKL